jgi:broad specificity phosphatase PhoE
MRLKAIERLYPGPLAVWRFEPDRLLVENGERLQDAYCRAARFLSGFLKSRLEGDVLVVGHGVTNSLIQCAAAGTAIGRIGEFAQPNASIAVLRIQRRAIVSIEGLKDESIN